MLFSDGGFPKLKILLISNFSQSDCLIKNIFEIEQVQHVSAPGFSQSPCFLLLSCYFVCLNLYFVWEFLARATKGTSLYGSLRLCVPAYRMSESNQNKSNQTAFRLDLYESNQIFHFDLFLLHLNRSK